MNLVFEVGGAYLAIQAARGRPIEHLVGWSALWALECVPYYLSQDDLANAAVASIRAAACGAVWIQARVGS